MDYAFISNAITSRRPLTKTRSLASSSPPLPPTNTSSPGGRRENKPCLKRSLNLMDLIFYGVGCSVGAGIYSLVGIGANLAGPAIAISFLWCGMACCFTSLAYAEFAARVPLAGSAYVFVYVSFGELCGWLVGWNLTLGYAVSAAVVARSWAEYLLGFFQGLVNVDLSWLTHAPLPSFLFGDENTYDCCPLAMVIIGLCTVVLVSGAKESTRFNTAMTILNLVVLGFVLLAGVGSGTVHVQNLTPVFPHGVWGMARGAGLVFFAYLGFDMVSCLSEEVQHPERNMPIGIIGSLLVSMSIYVAVSIVVVGMAPISLLGEDVPIVNALLANACCSYADQTLHGSEQVCLSYACSPILHPVLYMGIRLVSFGAIFGLTTATFACLMGQPRIFYSMAQDGLLFKIYARVHPKTGVPTVGTILTGILTALIACLIDLESLANAISLGTLQVFTFVNAGVIILRMRPHDNNNSNNDSNTEERQEDMDYAETSPLVRDAEAAILARSLGLVKQSSIQIRGSVRASQLSSSSGRQQLFVEDNGSKPHWWTLLFTIGSVMASASFSHNLPYKEWILAPCLVVTMGSAVALCRLPQTSPPDTFTCPMVPFVPLMGILCNSYMMGSMPISTWTVILVWLAAGLLFYFAYGIHHSELRVRRSSSGSEMGQASELSPWGGGGGNNNARTTSAQYDYSSIAQAASSS